ncbi:hypothetical protein HYFRA_00007343 [Hymenoscyphus fraxineus]|uniref:2EXR domain-containing protein n=1 Tax=Hymenoscyphus fraxineus TaxID=746836 RepID=A0A9N9PRF4_9HELO|nr:hypothetical protein HYFRA_00007343 [Hymenoscyphus fraxineus]
MSTMDLISPNTLIPSQDTNPSLPLEIQVMIFKLMIPPGRVIRLSFPQNPPNTTQEPSIPTIHDTARVQIPVLFHISRTSRALAKETFTLGFGREPSPLDRNYWNPLRDTIYLPPFNPHEQDTLHHFYLYTIFPEQGHEGAVLRQKFYQEKVKGERVRTLALDRIRHLAIPFPDNSCNDNLLYDRDIFVRNLLLEPRERFNDPLPYPERAYSIGKLNFGADRTLLGGCTNLESLHFVGDDSMFTGKCRMSRPTIKLLDVETSVDHELLRQTFALNWDSGEVEDLETYRQFLGSFETYIEAVKGIDCDFARWEVPEMGVGVLEFEEERVGDFCTLPKGREGDASGEEEDEEEESDYDSDYLSDDSID